MTLVRLSKVESGGSSNSSDSSIRYDTKLSRKPSQCDPIENVWPASRSRTTRYACRSIALTLLTLSAVCILLSLLLPTYKHGLSVFTIKPVGHQWISNDGHAENFVDVFDPVSSGSSNNVRGLAETNERRDARRSRSINQRTAPTDGELVRKSLSFDTSDTSKDDKVIWFGLDGPTVWVGTMQICSKSDWHAETICTSASRAAYHIRDLPLSLGDALLALPQKPIAPILLLITAITTLLAILVYTIPMMIRAIGSWRGGRSSVRHPQQAESVADVAKTEITEDESVHLPHPTFLGLMLIAAVLGIAGAAVEGAAMRSAQRAWNKKTGDDIGLVFKSAGIASMLPFIPTLLLIATITAYTPLMIHLSAQALVARRQVAAPPPSPPIQENGAEIIHRAEISDLFAETVADSGKRTSRGSIIFSEISPQSPPMSIWSRMSSRMPTIHGIPEEHEPMPTTGRSSWMTEHAGGEPTRNGQVEDVRGSRHAVDERDEKSESWGTFGVGQAV